MQRQRPVMKNRMSRRMAGRLTRTRHAVMMLCIQYTFLHFSIMLKKLLNYEVQHGSTFYTLVFLKTKEQGH